MKNSFFFSNGKFCGKGEKFACDAFRPSDKFSASPNVSPNVNLQHFSILKLLISHCGMPTYKNDGKKK